MSWKSRIFEKFSRVTSSGAFIPEIDGIRFVAISSVVFYHIYALFINKCTPLQGEQIHAGYLRLLFYEGFLGVQLFFVISGFILGLPFAKHYLQASPPVSLRKYYTRRLTRLEPPYVIHLMVLCCVSLAAVNFGHIDTVAPLDSSPGTFIIKHLLARLVYCHTFIFGACNRLNGALWSLEIEVQFYILVPLITRLFTIQSKGRRRTAIVLIILAFSILSLFITQAKYARLESSIIGQLHFFLCGFLLADVYLLEWKERPLHEFKWDFVCLTGWIAIPVVYAITPLRPAMPFVIFVAYVAVFRSVIFNTIFRNPWLTTIGGMCYTIYMYHNLIVTAVGSHTFTLTRNLPGSMALIIQLALISIIVLIPSAFLFLYSEKTFMYRDWHLKALNEIRNWTKGRASEREAA